MASAWDSGVAPTRLHVIVEQKSVHKGESCPLCFVLIDLTDP